MPAQYLAKRTVDGFQSPHPLMDCRGGDNPVASDTRFDVGGRAHISAIGGDVLWRDMQ